MLILKIKYLDEEYGDISNEQLLADFRTYPENFDLLMLELEFAYDNFPAVEDYIYLTNKYEYYAKHENNEECDEE